MTSFSRMPRYDIRNDGYGPYAIFYCDVCGREFRSRPDVGKAVTQDIGRSALGGLLGKGKQDPQTGGTWGGKTPKDGRQNKGEKR